MPLAQKLSNRLHSPKRQELRTRGDIWYNTYRL